MKSKSEFVTGIIGLIFCIISIWNLGTISGTSSGLDLLGPDTFPKSIIFFMFLSSCVLIVKGFTINDPKKYWPELFIIKKIIAVVISFICYIILLIFLDSWFETFNKSWLDNNSAFAVSTYFYMLIIMYITGRQKLIEFIVIPILVPVLIVACFMYGFNVFLP